MRAHFVFDVFLLKPYTDNPFFIESEESYTTQLIGKTMSLTTVLGNQQKVSMHLTQKGPGKGECNVFKESTAQESIYTVKPTSFLEETFMEMDLQYPPADQLPTTVEYRHIHTCTDHESAHPPAENP
ncbi:hypothetical protein Y1Q_0002137 [Alligator mississippiensis]|uniref:Uncharacterized protein n=1 Tax=Alligator mississippiensis TaxID=8496 RepID=A0A151MPV3_ALLMI|nr:hypothetical protein Y1Q_0002137 [Alligator mississippiensis]